jgi:hypothetical protein
MRFSPIVSIRTGIVAESYGKHDRRFDGKESSDGRDQQYPPSWFSSYDLF